MDGDNLAVLRCLRRRALRQLLPVYVVGGPVRDLLTGMPIKDLDFVVEGDGPELANWLAGELGGKVVTHARFGTSTLVMGHCRVDVVTARRETYPQPAVLPQVFPGAISDDLARRDFSINALALPLAETHPKVLDLHGGVNDIRRRLIRILHPNSFLDDPTRILRAVRYEQRLGFEMEDGTRRRLRDAIAEGHLASLTGDRLRHELERILLEDRPELALKRSVTLGILAEIHPSLGDEEATARLEAVTSNDRAPGGSALADPGPLVYISALAYPLSRQQAEAVIQRLNMPGLWEQAVRDVILLREREEELAVDSLRGSQLAGVVEGLCNEAVLAVARLTGAPLVAERLAKYLNEIRFMAPALDGRRLLAMGVPEGPAIGQVLRQLREARLDGDVSTEEEERRLVQEFINQHGRPSGHA